MRIFFLAFCFSVISNSFSYSQTFLKTYSGGWHNNLNQGLKTMDGGFIMGGSFHVLGGSDYIYLVRTNLFGDTVWTRTYGHAAACYSICQTNDSGFLIVGERYDTLNIWKSYLLKINSNGNFESLRDIDNENIHLYSVLQTTDGGFLMAGDSGFVGVTDTINAVLIKTDSACTIEWSKKIEVGESNNLNKVLITSDGNYLLFGYSVSNNGSDSSLYLMKLDTAGSIIWSKGYLKGTNYLYPPPDVKESFDGGFIITSNEGLVIKTDANGDAIWEKKYNFQIYSVCQTSDSGFALTGEHFGLIKNDSYGNIIWSKSYDPYGTFAAFCVSINANADGSFTLMGAVSDNGTTGLFCLAKTDSNGDNCSATSLSVNNYSIPVQPQIPANAEWSTGILTSNKIINYTIDSWMQNICEDVGLNNNSFTDKSLLSIDPNPFTSTTMIHFSNSSSEKTYLTLFNSFGEIVFRKEIIFAEQTLNLSELSKGIYFVMVISGERTFTSKIIKQ